MLTSILPIVIKRRISAETTCSGGKVRRTTRLSGRVMQDGRLKELKPLYPETGLLLPGAFRGLLPAKPLHRLRKIRARREYPFFPAFTNGPFAPARVSRSHLRRMALLRYSGRRRLLN